VTKAGLLCIFADGAPLSRILQPKPIEMKALKKIRNFPFPGEYSCVFCTEVHRRGDLRIRANALSIAGHRSLHRLIETTLPK